MSVVSYATHTHTQREKENDQPKFDFDVQCNLQANRLSFESLVLCRT